MTDDPVALAEDALNGTTCTDEMVDFFRVGLVRKLVSEVRDARFFTQQIEHALSPGGGDEWDAEDLIELIRVAQQDADVHRAQARQWRELWREGVETASAAMRERDEANAQLATLQRLLRNPQVVAVLAAVDEDEAVEMEVGDGD